MMTIRLKIITLLQRIPTGWRLRPNKEMYFIYDYNKKIRNVDVFIFLLLFYPPTARRLLSYLVVFTVAYLQKKRPWSDNFS
jgi:hypothetical protein